MQHLWIMASSSNALGAAIGGAVPPALAGHIETTFNGKTVELSKLADLATSLAVNLVVAILILSATLWLASWGATIARGLIARWPRTKHDVTLQSFASSVVRYSIVIVGVIAILRRLGVETTSIITVLGAASLAVGLALQGALSNVAAGVMVLIFRPYRVGDVVTIAGRIGTVKRLDLFNTELSDADGLKVVVPNAKGFGDVVVNYTDIPRRRIQHQFGIDYGDNIEQAIAIVLDTARADPRILTEPEPWCMVTELAASQVTVELRAWTHLSDYWTARFDMLRKVKEAFDAAGITIPYPTQTSVTKETPAPDEKGAPPPAPPPQSSAPQIN